MIYGRNQKTFIVLVYHLTQPQTGVLRMLIEDERPSESFLGPD